MTVRMICIGDCEVFVLKAEKACILMTKNKCVAIHEKQCALVTEECVLITEECVLMPVKKCVIITKT